MNRIVRERQQVESTLKELRKQLGDYQAKLKSTRKNEASSMAALRNIRKQIQVYEALIVQNQALLNNLNGEIDQLQSELDENRKSYHHVSSDFRRIAVAAYKHGGDRDAELMLSSGSAGDAMARSKYIGFLSGSVRTKVNDLQSSAQRMETSQAQLQVAYRQKEAAMKAQQEELKSYSSKQKEKEVVLGALKKDKEAYAAKITEVRRKQRQMQARIESLIMAQQELIRKEQERARAEALRRQRLVEARRKAAEQQRLAAARRRVAELQRYEAARRREAEQQRLEAARRRSAAEKQPEKPETAQKPEKTDMAVRQLPGMKPERGRVPAVPPPPPPPPEDVPKEEYREPTPVMVDATESEIDRVSANFDAGGSLPWPVSNGVIVRRFGPNRDKELNLVTINNGIDVSVPTGTPVKSVSGGKVVQITYLPTFGNVVIVRHPKSYLTVYANLARVSVSKGEIIRSRQLLGSSASMPEGGSIVHFEIWKGREKQNPQKWLR